MLISHADDVTNLFFSSAGPCKGFWSFSSRYHWVHFDPWIFGIYDLCYILCYDITELERDTVVILHSNILPSHLQKLEKHLTGNKSFHFLRKANFVKVKCIRNLHSGLLFVLSNCSRTSLFCSFFCNLWPWTMLNDKSFCVSLNDTYCHFDSEQEPYLTEVWKDMDTFDLRESYLSKVL